MTEGETLRERQATPEQPQNYETFRYKFDVPGVQPIENFFLWFTELGSEAANKEPWFQKFENTHPEVLRRVRDAILQANAIEIPIFAAVKHDLVNRTLFEAYTIAHQYADDAKLFAKPNASRRS